VPLQYYSSGTNGPEAANLLLQEDGFKWWLDKESGEQAKVKL